MSPHLDRDALLRYHFRLDDPETDSLTPLHLRECSTCRKQLSAIEDQEQSVVATYSVPDASSGLHTGNPNWWMSRSLPLACVLVGAVAAALLALWHGTFALAPIAVCGFLSTAWLYIVVSKIERDWTAVTTVNWNVALPTAPEVQIRFLQGLSVSAVQSIRNVQGSIKTVLYSSAVLVSLGLAVLILSSLVLPGSTEHLRISAASTLFIAVFSGSLLAALLWGLWRMKVLVDSTRRLLKELHLRVV